MLKRRPGTCSRDPDGLKARAALRVYSRKPAERTLYIGVTNDIARRIYEHRQGAGSKFTRRYGALRLVYAEPYEDIRLALWNDLYTELNG